MATEIVPKTSTCEGGQTSRSINAKAKRERAVEMARKQCAAQGFAVLSEIAARVKLSRHIICDALRENGFHYHPDKVWREVRP